jgi:hypothetical protein
MSVDVVFGPCGMTMLRSFCASAFVCVTVSVCVCCVTRTSHDVFQQYMEAIEEHTEPLGIVVRTYRYPLNPGLRDIVYVSHTSSDRRCDQYCDVTCL